MQAPLLEKRPAFSVGTLLRAQFLHDGMGALIWYARIRLCVVAGKRPDRNPERCDRGTNGIISERTDLERSDRERWLNSIVRRERTNLERSDRKRWRDAVISRERTDVERSNRDRCANPTA